MKPKFIPLNLETREVISTVEAAQHVDMQPKGLRHKAANDPDFPLKPVRIMRRLLWRTSDIKKLLGVAT